MSVSTAHLDQIQRHAQELKDLANTLPVGKRERIYNLARFILADAAEVQRQIVMSRYTPPTEE